MASINYSAILAILAMLVIIHGDDELTSRNYFVSQKDDNSLTFDSETIILNELEQSLNGSDLFGKSGKIFIENLFTRVGTKNLNEIAKVLGKKNKADVFIWADRLLPAKTLQLFPNHKSQVFKISQNIWSFLDNIKPENHSNVSMFHNVLVSTEPEIVFAMIIRQFRLMLGLSDNSNNNIDEVKRLAPWQKSKLIRQTSLFGLDKLKAIYKKLYRIEKQMKTGKSNLTLIQNIDILLLDL